MTASLTDVDFLDRVRRSPRLAERPDERHDHDRCADMNPVVVIGAGLAGLSAACYLAGRGYDVTVVEREELPGGRAGILHQRRIHLRHGADGAHHAGPDCRCRAGREP